MLDTAETVAGDKQQRVALVWDKNSELEETAQANKRGSGRVERE